MSSRQRGGPPDLVRALRVLVVEDDRDCADSWRDLLALMGYSAVVAYGGEEAVALARFERPEVVLCALVLPVMDGFAVARALRAMSAEAPLLLIAVTGLATDQHRRGALEAGFDHFLVKPPDLELLRRLLAERAASDAPE